ncbi:BMP family ABC transporter substrate-binding protein [Komagataeibacter melaceti]|uniref:BMP family ABC transporter substrate-binding protein n=1 Tax=Komagataeibacter melaceti TaxID=2766577 RepID=UPI00268DBF6E
MTSHHDRSRRNAHLGRRGFLQAAALAGFAPGLLPARAHAAALPPVREADALVAFGHVGPVSDGGWTTLHHQAMQKLRAEFPALQTMYVEDIPYSADAERIFRHFVAEGAQMVFATSSYGDFLRDVSDRAPEVAFMECDGRNPGPNLGWYYLAHWYPSYVIGVAAGLLSRSGRLGYIASFPLPSCYAGANATLMGARSVNPRATVQVMSINAWFDPQAATQAAQALVSAGCDFLCGIMDEPAYLRVAEQEGVWAAMWNSDMRRFGPDHYVSSVVADFSHFYVEQVRARLNGTWTPGEFLLPLGGGVDRDAWGRNVPISVQQQADAVRARIIGGWQPFTGPLYDNHGQLRLAAGQSLADTAIYNWNWAVEGVTGL